MDDVQNTEGTMPATPAKDAPEVDPARAALVKEWLDRVKKGLTTAGPAFKRMDTCMKIAAHGTNDDSWVTSDHYVVPILNRHINLSVAQLYAKHPTVTVKRKERMLFTIWDGKPESAQAALEAFSMGDINQKALLDDILQAQQYIMLLDKIAKTMQICWGYFLSEQEYDYKAQLKAMVRRAKVCGVAYIKLGFQRILEKDPDKTRSIADVTSKIAAIEALMAKDEYEKGPEDASVEELRLSLADLQQQEEILVREGPVLSFPKSKNLVIDPACKHLKTFAGGRWVAEYFDLDCEEILETYKIDVKTSHTVYKEKMPDGEEASKARVWQIWDRKHRQCLTICEGYPDFLKEPGAPDVKLERFYPYFPLVLNEIESDKDLYPPSDVWLARHPQEEINRSRQGLREHRIANRPWYGARKGALEESDKAKLASHAAHEIIEFNGLGPGDDVEKVVKRGVNIPIDPPQYEIEGHLQDILRSVGSQDANFGPTTGATATETSIAENSRQSNQSDNVDDLDDLLTNLARSGGQLMLAELSKQTVLEIAGPGAAWPEHEMTRVEIAKDLQLEIEAGSSGRPNKAAKLADLERAAPTVLQLSGINPKPFAKKYLGMLDIDIEEGYIEGLPSITAMNAMIAKAATQPGTGDPATDPKQQGGQGGNNAPQPGQGQNQSQPAFPAPASGVSVTSGGAI